MTRSDNLPCNGSLSHDKGLMETSRSEPFSTLKKNTLFIFLRINKFKKEHLDLQSILYFSLDSHKSLPSVFFNQWL